jgi:glycosyltransferase domain-containing protein
MRNPVLDQISIVIPTLDRPEWCIRLINYYAKSNFSGYLIFCDSSSTGNYRKLNKYVKASKNNKIVHLKLAGVTLHKALEHGIAIASKKTSFFTQSGDDDFFDLLGLVKCAEYLISNQEYFSCVGEGFIIKYHEKGNKFKFKWVIKYWNPRQIKDISPNDRIFNILANYYNLEFSLRRTEGVIKGYKEMNKFLGNLSFQQSTIAEICSVMNIAFAGKSHFINTPYLFRGEHSNRPNAIKNLYPNSIYIFENRIQTYERYQIILNKNLKNLAGLQLIIRKFFLYYTENVFRKINRKNGRYYKFSQLPIRIQRKVFGIMYKSKYRKLIETFR